VERLTFDERAAFSPADPRLQRVAIAPLTASLQAGSSIQAAIFRLATGGRIARHPATVPQILAVLEGTGRVSGADGTFEPIAAGQAVTWAQGEEHETESDDGMTVLILEAEGLVPFHGRGSS